MRKITLIKQDINFLDKPLWFVEVRHDGLGFIWTDMEGFKYRTGYKLPDKVDNLILFYLLLKSQQNNYQSEIPVGKYEILKACGFPTSDPKYYQRIEESLSRWKNVAIEFHGSFYEHGKHITIGFGIIDDYEINKDTKSVNVNFNKNWILKIKNSTFFKLINFEYYKVLKRPVSRRLYELLCKNFKGRSECYFKLTTLGSKLTLSGIKKKKGDKEEETLYASHVLLALKPAINEINKLAKSPDISKKTGIAAEDIFSVSYRIEGEKQERVIHLKKEPAFPPEVQQQEMASSSTLPLPEMTTIVPEGTRNTQTMPDKPQIESQAVPQEKSERLPYQLETQYNEFVLWLQETAPDFNFKTLQHIDREEIAAYFPKLKSKIELDLGKGKVANVGGYILECLRNKWDIPLSSKEAKRKREEEIRQQEQQKRQAENERQAKIEAEAKRFKEIVGTIDSEVKEKLWQEADAMTPKNMPGNLHVAITYSNLLLKYVNENMEANLMPEAADSLKVVKAVALHKPGWKEPAK